MPKLKYPFDEISAMMYSSDCAICGIRADAGIEYVGFSVCKRCALTELVELIADATLIIPGTPARNTVEEMRHVWSRAEVEFWKTITDRLDAHRRKSQRDKNIP